MFSSHDTDVATAKKLRPLKIDCPVFIPDSAAKHPWGDVFDAYGIQSLPTTISIDGAGVIRAYDVGYLVAE